MTATREVKLPEDLCKKVEQLYEKQFGGLDQFLTFVLEELSRDSASRADKAEQQIIEERLKDLGYV
ncbi:MAG TPA: hypothetical protein VLK33_14315 [Terriglobales bacterium]|nr:hypothetical protein [Terriglobales bacterium]